jgi:hypothetical protein
MIFRRGKLRLAAWYLVPLTFWLMAGLFTFAFLAGLSPIRCWTFEKAGVLLAIAILAFICAQNARRFQTWASGFSKTFLALEPEGLRFRNRETGEVSVPWSEITNVTFEKRWVDSNTLIQFRTRLDACITQTGKGIFTFTAMDIPSPKRATEAISIRLGR